MIPLDTLVERLQDRLSLSLPGASAHEPMRATAIGDVIPNFLHKTPPKPGSVIILLYEDEHGIRFPLIKRPQYLGTHSNQVSLPGGKAELDEFPVETALREAEEEIGVSRENIVVVGSLSQFFVVPSNFIVTPVVAVTRQPVFTPDRREVARILRGDVSSLLNTNAIKTKEILAAGMYRMMAPHFEVEDEIVWGATAMMLNEFRQILLEIR